MMPRLVRLTLPPLGEGPDSSAEAVVQRYDELIRISAPQHQPPCPLWVVGLRGCFFDVGVAVLFSVDEEEQLAEPGHDEQD